MPPKNTPVPLAGARAGVNVKVVNVAGGIALQSRLMGLGLIPSARLEVIRNDRRGPMILALRRTRIGIGRAMAEKVQVQILSTAPAGRGER